MAGVSCECVVETLLCDFRLGSIACLADPDDLYVYKGTESFSVIRESIMSCTRKGLRLPSDLVGTELMCSSFTVFLNVYFHVIIALFVCLNFVGRFSIFY